MARGRHLARLNRARPAAGGGRCHTSVLDWWVWVAVEPWVSSGADRPLAATDLSGPRALGIVLGAAVRIAQHVVRGLYLRGLYLAHEPTGTRGRVSSRMVGPGERLIRGPDDRGVCRRADLQHVVETGLRLAATRDLAHSDLFGRPDSAGAGSSTGRTRASGPSWTHSSNGKATRAGRSTTRRLQSFRIMDRS